MDSTRPTLVTEAQHREFAERGLFITGPLFTPDELAPIRAECARIYEASLAEENRPVARRVRPFVPEVHKQSPVVASFLRHPVFQSLAYELIGPDADQAWNQACLKMPDQSGLTEFPFHQDSQFADLDTSGRGFACFIALAPLTVENGTLHFAAATHSRQLDHRWDDALNWWKCDVSNLEIVPGILEPGALVVYHPKTPHGSPANRSGFVREAFLASFGPPEIRVVATGELYGDQRPLLRGGDLVNEV